MTLILRHSASLGDLDPNVPWCKSTDTMAALPSSRMISDVGALLEKEFEGTRDSWWEIGKVLGQTPSAHLAHMPTAASYNCDFGLQLSWVRIAKRLSESDQIHLFVCDDPWVFRQIAEIDDVDSGTPPPIWVKAAKYWIRGYLARLKLSFKAIVASLRLRRTRSKVSSGKPALIVYAHPGSSKNGQDIYFGRLMNKFPEIERLIHTDGDLSVAENLSYGNGRTASLHGWGKPIFALPLKSLNGVTTLCVAKTSCFLNPSISIAILRSSRLNAPKA